MATTDDKTNDEMDAEAGSLWLLERTPEVVNRIVQIFEPYVDRRVSMMLRKNPNIDDDDAKQNGWFALATGAERFDHTRGIRFTTFIQRRVDGAIIDAAREADTAPTKLRAQEKKGEIEPLPVMFPLGDSFDAVANNGGLPVVTLDIADLLDSVRDLPSLVRDINAALDHRWDFEEIGKAMGCSPTHAAYTVKLSLERAKDPEAYRELLRGLPPYLKPTDGPRVQQVMFMDVSA